MATELMKAEKFELTTISGELAEAVAEEMDGLGTIPYDRVKVPSGGGIAFEIPTEDEKKPDVATEIVGVILDHHPVNARWDEKYDGQKNPPVCTAYDGHNGIVAETGECCDCASCKYNQFGSADDGKGKICKNTHRLYVLRPGNPIPIVLTLPPTSIKAARDYFAKSVVLKGNRCYEVITKIGLVKEESGDGITYSRATFTLCDKLTPEQIEQTKSMAEVIKSERQHINEIENAAAAQSGDGMSDIETVAAKGVDTDLPFNEI